MSKSFNYCSDGNLNMNSFVKAPGELIFGKEYAGISAQAKYLLIIMLARFELSVKNNWKDKDGNSYIIFSHRDARDLLACSETKVKKLYSELIKEGIIKTKKQGLGKPNLIYINADLFFTDSKSDSTQRLDTTILTDAENLSEESLENSLESLSETSKYNNNNYINNNYINNNYINNNYINHITLSSEQELEEEIEERQEYKDLIKHLIAYDYLISNNYNSSVLNCIIEALVNMLCTKGPTVRIGKRDIPYMEVKTRIYRINVNIVESLYESLKGIRNTIRNPTSYLATAIYNSLDSACMGFPG